MNDTETINGASTDLNALFAELDKRYRRAKGLIGEIEGLTREVATAADAKRAELVDMIAAGKARCEPETIAAFLKEPYAVIPLSKSEFIVVVPRFIRFQVGWLERSTPSYNIFRVNRFSRYLGEVPAALEALFKFGEPLSVHVFDGMAVAKADERDAVWDKYRRHLQNRVGDDRIRIKTGCEFDFIAALIADGTLPFIPRPVEKGDLREPPRELGFELGAVDEKVRRPRAWQPDARERFFETGAVGVFWPPGTGKTFFGMQLLAELRGRKVIVVPSLTLVEQWEAAVEHYCGRVVAGETVVVTYNAFHKIRDEEWVLAIFDEAHHLPANTYAKLSTLNAKYRVGLSATPHREDGRENYIFALTGYPIGISWLDLIDAGFITVPDVRIYVVGTSLKKTEKLVRVLGESPAAKTVVFCDEIAYGKSLSRELDAPFVYGETDERLKIIGDSELTVVSRVGDEGMSIPEIERVIEVDFLFGSRRQELQRVGRLFHARGRRTEHIVIVTEKEYEAYSKRFLVYEEKGIKYEVIRA